MLMAPRRSVTPTMAPRRSITPTPITPMPVTTPAAPKEGTHFGWLIK